MLDQLYQDFTTKLLPKIQEGLVIGKDYFMDLFGRYIKYLIIIDSLWIFLGLILLIVGSYSLYRAKKYMKEDNGLGFVWMLVGGIMPIVISAMIIINSIDNLVKDIYIPEVRIIEEIKTFNR